ncbi:MAG: hypothetical protein JWQ40_4306 [Segetibacter sp.]|nr:hypothetical protein [Segetibacter sp.]
MNYLVILVIRVLDDFAGAFKYYDSISTVKFEVEFSTAL